MLHLPQNFSADVLAGRTAQAQLLVDARRSNTALLLQGYAADIVADYAAGPASRPHAAGAADARLVQSRRWRAPGSSCPAWSACCR